MSKLLDHSDEDVPEFPRTSSNGSVGFINASLKNKRKSTTKGRKPFVIRSKTPDMENALLDDEHLMERYETLLESDPNYFKIPSDLELSVTRAHANHVSSFTRPYPEGALPLFISKKFLKRYSTSYFLFFSFVEESIIVLFIVFFISCIFDMAAISLLTAPRMEPDLTAPLSGLYYVTILDKDPPNYVITIKLALNLLSIIIVKLYILRKEIQRTNTYSDTYQTFTENDFSIVVNLLPASTTIEDLHNYFTGKCEELGFGSIHHIILIEDTSRVLELKLKKKKIVLDFLKSKRYENRKRKHQLKEINKIESDIIEIRLQQAQETSIHKAAIVVFETPRTNALIANQWRKLGGWTRAWIRIFRRFKPDYKSKYNFKGELITVKKCGEPADMLYQNLAIHSAKRNFRKYLAVFVVVFFSLLYPGFQIGYQFLFVIKITHNEGVTIKTQSTFVRGLLLTGLSFIIYAGIKLAIVFLAKTQLMRRKSDIDKFKLVATIILTFINYNLVLVGKLLTYTDNQSRFINDIFYVLGGMIFMPQIVELFDPEFWYKYFRRMFLRKKSAVNELSQAEADELYENPSFDFSARVVNISSILFTSLSTYTFFPLSPMIGMFAILSSYLVDRYLILRRCPNLNIRGYELGMHCFRTFRYDVLAQSFGNIILCTYLHTQNQLNIANFVLSMIFVALNGTYIICCSNTLMNLITKGTDRKKTIKESKPAKCYSDVRHSFKHSYYDEYKTFLEKNDMLTLMRFDENTYYEMKPMSTSPIVPPVEQRL